MKTSKRQARSITTEIVGESQNSFLVRQLAKHGHLPMSYITKSSKLSEKQLQEVLEKYKNGTLRGPAFQVNQ